MATSSSLPRDNPKFGYPSRNSTTVSITTTSVDTVRVLLEQVQEFSSLARRIQIEQITVDGKILQWQANDRGTYVTCQGPHPVPVHRLGRGTSGILPCAKTKLAKARLASYFADGTSHIERSRDTNKELEKIAKIYRALVSGIVDNDKVIIKQPIGTIKYPGVDKGLYVASPSGKPALSVVDVLERNIKENCTLVQVQIQSGRPHQIRIHLSFIGHPLLGDPLYVVGGQPKCFDYNFPDEIFAEDGVYPNPTQPAPGDCGSHLHAHQLVISHPMTSEVIEIIAPVPTTLQIQDEAKEFGV